MIVTCVYVHVKSEFIGKFIEATTANHRGSVREPGNLRFDLLQQADDPARFMVYEAYESAEAASAHKETNHYTIWRETVQDMMAEPRTGVRYDILQPENKSDW
ncbi:MAG: antibiotic biosynthesis monooxygenase [Bacteroidales bacterium]|nr:antibiotic biosynthesis monooxygenase [Bacteroidales bacterium]